MKKENKYYYLGISTNKGTPINKEKITDEYIENRYKNIKNELEKKHEKLLKKENSEKELLKLKRDFINLSDAYLTLRTKDGRDKYEHKSLQKEQIKNNIRELIKEEDKYADNEIIIRNFNKGNKATNIEKDDSYLEYTTEYEDDKILIWGMEKIKFVNGLDPKDILYKYNLNIKNDNNLIKTKEFYSNIDKNLLNDSQYKISLYKALYRSIENEEDYIGIITPENENYVVKIDDGQKNAINQYKEIKERDNEER